MTFLSWYKVDLRYFISCDHPPNCSCPMIVKDAWLAYECQIALAWYILKVICLWMDFGSTNSLSKRYLVWVAEREKQYEWPKAGRAVIFPLAFANVYDDQQFFICALRLISNLTRNAIDFKHLMVSHFSANKGEASSIILYSSTR